MQLSRTSRIAFGVLAGALALSACGSDNNTGATAGDGAKIDCASGDVKGAGSTFQKNIVAQWIKDYTAACSGASIDYQGVGSGAGIKQLGEGTIDFAGSDSAMKDEERTAVEKTCGSPAIHLPVTAGGIAIAYNLKGVDSLQLSPATIAGIFQGTITTWDDAAVKADNPGVTLPSTVITAIHREDSSGTTNVLSKFLSATAKADWKLGEGKELSWPSTVQGAKGSDGVTGAAAAADGGVTYIEDSFVESGGLKAAKVKNGAGEYTALEGDTVSKALAGASVPDTGDDLKVSYDFANTTAGAYPITAVSYEIVCTKGKDAAKQALIKSFLTYAVGAGQDSAEANGFAPLPTALATRVAAVVGTLS
jgi:phosphate transport system substrate-binding protein